MGCNLSNFDINGPWAEERLPDGGVLSTAPAATKGLRLDGVVYKVDGVFQGFTGDVDAARYWALDRFAQRANMRLFNDHRTVRAARREKRRNDGLWHV